MTPEKIIEVSIHIHVIEWLLNGYGHSKNKKYIYDKINLPTINENINGAFILHIPTQKDFSTQLLLKKYLDFTIPVIYTKQKINEFTRSFNPEILKKMLDEFGYLKSKKQIENYVFKNGIDLITALNDYTYDSSRSYL